MKPNKTDKYARYKVASIPVLLCILGYVLLSPSQKRDQLSVELQAAASVPAAPQLAAKVASGKQAKTTGKWPEADLEFLSLPNPLADYKNPP